MRRKKLVTLLLATLFGFSQTTEAKIVHLLPKPKTVEATASAAFPLSGNYVLNDATNNVALKKFFTNHGMTEADGAALTVNVKQVASIANAYDYTLAGYENEAYTLEITSNTINISYINPIGVTRAAQTLVQLAEGYEGTPELETLTLSDWPAFKLRGYMHDVGRSFLSVTELKKQIELLSRFKVNTFHWHLTENQAWRFEVKAYPKLTSSESMTRYAGSFYTQEECKEVAACAKEHGITIIPEIDMPGHSAAFERAMGVEMQSAKGMEILSTVLEEVVEVFKDAPYIHIGADEKEITNAEFLPTMISKLHGLNKKVVVWNPIRNVTISNLDIDMTQMWSTSGSKIAGVPNIDCRYNYTNHFDVFADLVGIYKSSIYYTDKGNAEVAGTISAAWNDRKVPTEDDIVKQNNIYANIIASAERGWKGGGKQYIEKGGTTLPNSGDEYEEYKDWETRFLFHKANSLDKVSIPYVKQTNVRWRITDAFPNGGDMTAVFPPEQATTDILPDVFEYKGATYGTGIATGAGIYLKHTWGTTVPAYYSSPADNSTAYAWTYVYSKEAQTVGALIEFQNYGRSEVDRAPDAGNWDRKGSRIWINDTEVQAPTWGNSGKGINHEVDLQNENFTARAPISVSLKAGWNKVFIKLPYVGANGVRLNKWMFTCVFTDQEGKNAVEGLIYSPNKCVDDAAEEVAAKISEMKSYRRSKANKNPGYYAEELASAFDAKIAAIEATLPNELSASERATQIEDLEAAKSAFDTACVGQPLTQPTISTTDKSVFYTLSTPLRGNRYATSMGANVDMVGETAASTAAYWKFVRRADGNLDIINCADGTYVSPESSNNTALKTQSTSPSKGWTLKAANEVGYFAIVSGTTQFNQTNNSTLGWKVYNWGSGTNTDDTGCKYAINEVDLDEYTVIFVDETGKSVGSSSRILVSPDQDVTADAFAAILPAGYAISAFQLSGNTYTVTIIASGTPVPGCYYYFYNKHQAGNKYFYDNNGAVGFASSKSVGDESHIWKCVANGDSKLDFVNLATGRYFAWKSLATSAYGWTVDATLGSVNVGGVVNKGCVTMKGVTGSSNYLVVKSNNTFDQSTRAGYYNATFSSDFVFEPCGNDVRMLTIESPAVVNATFAFGDKTSSNSFLINDNLQGNLVVESYNTAYKFEGFYDGETLIETVNASTITESKTLVARFSLDVFSTTYGEKWVRINWKDASGDAMGLSPIEGTSYKGGKAKSVALDMTDEEQLWCLVGNAQDGFKLQSKVAGKSFALAVSSAESAAAAEFKAVSLAHKWKIVEKGNLFAITPASNTGLSLNSYGGARRELKLYGANDAGSQWSFECVAENLKMVVEVAGENPYPENNYLAGEMSFSLFGNTSISRVDVRNTDSVQYYLPVGAKLTLAQGKTYRGFKATGIKVNNVAAAEAQIKLSNEPVIVTCSYEVDTDNKAQNLYYSPSASDHPYRIPAIVTAKNGDVIAVNDHRPCGNDVGAGEVDVYVRVSKDHGETWSVPKMIANGTGVGGAVDCGFGDAALCADAERNEILMMLVCGNVFYPYSTRANPNRASRFTAKLNEETGEWEWTTFNQATDELTEQIYRLFDEGDVNNDGTPDPLSGMFIASGRLFQSKHVKVGEYYRIYAALCAKPNGNRVIFSDDFGKTWAVLGGNKALPAPGGDEPKCEELPDGSVILSSRTYGRIFNIFKYSDVKTGEGSWLGPVTSNSSNNGIIANGNSTNGDIMLVDAIRKSDRTKVRLALQSVPFGNGRANVGLFFKEITPAMYDNVTSLASNWTRGLQVSYESSAYSAITLQQDGRFGFFLEDGPYYYAGTNIMGYSMVYEPLTLEEITKDAYELDLEATGIDQVIDEESKKGNGEIFDLYGRRVLNPKKGIYVRDGQKFMVR
ncbi:MAG: family 20 glycosylhydrolase [Paraprevotella sp.]|nr:family 20 glycosylhydrolase [Paraprevotella sp.]